MIKLSERLETIAKCVTKGNSVADIGSDHALLPVYLVQCGHASMAIAGELNPGPYAAACKQVQAAGLLASISVRRGDGLAVIAPGEVETITIAGMGGVLMAHILENGHVEGKLEGVRELVLQPNVGEDAVRSWLLRRDWHLRQEIIVLEDEKFYEVLHAERVEDAAEQNRRLYDPDEIALCGLVFTQEELLKYGPYFLRQPSELWHYKWSSELDKQTRITGQLARSTLAAARDKQAVLQAERDKLMEVLTCTQMAIQSFN